MTHDQVASVRRKQSPGAICCKFISKVLGMPANAIEAFFRCQVPNLSFQILCRGQEFAAGVKSDAPCKLHAPQKMLQLSCLNVPDAHNVALSTRRDELGVRTERQAIEHGMRSILNGREYESTNLISRGWFPKPDQRILANGNELFAVRRIRDLIGVTEMA